jgi:hypothetical protein
MSPITGKTFSKAYYTSLSLDNTGIQWVRQFILQMFNVSWDMWEHRNGIKHNTVTPAKPHKLDAVDAWIQDEFVTGSTQFLPQDKRWLAESPDALINKYSLVEKNQWLASVACAQWRWTRCRLLYHPPSHSRGPAVCILPLAAPNTKHCIKKNAFVTYHCDILMMRSLERELMTLNAFSHGLNCFILVVLEGFCLADWSISGNSKSSYGQ